MTEQHQPDHSGRKAFKVTMFGCLGIVAAFIVVIFLAAFCTAMMSAPDHPRHHNHNNQALVQSRVA